MRSSPRSERSSNRGRSRSHRREWCRCPRADGPPCRRPSPSCRPGAISAGRRPSGYRPGSCRPRRTGGGRRRCSHRETARASPAWRSGSPGFRRATPSPGSATKIPLSPVRRNPGENVREPPCNRGGSQTHGLWTCLYRLGEDWPEIRRKLPPRAILRRPARRGVTRITKPPSPAPPSMEPGAPARCAVNDSTKPSQNA